MVVRGIAVVVDRTNGGVERTPGNILESAVDENANANENVRAGENGDVDDGDFHRLDFFLVVLCAVGGDGTREGGAGEGQGGCDGGELHDCSLVGWKVDLMGDGCAVGER